jgi:hypothetical protein
MQSSLQLEEFEIANGNEVAVYRCGAGLLFELGKIAGDDGVDRALKEGV